MKIWFIIYYSTSIRPTRVPCWNILNIKSWKPYEFMIFNIVTVFTRTVIPPPPHHSDSKFAYNYNSLRYCGFHSVHSGFSFLCKIKKELIFLFLRRSKRLDNCFTKNGPVYPGLYACKICDGNFNNNFLHRHVISFAYIPYIQKCQ